MMEDQTNQKQQASQDTETDNGVGEIIATAYVEIGGQMVEQWRHRHLVDRATGRVTHEYQLSVYLESLDSGPGL